MTECGVKGNGIFFQKKILKRVRLTFIPNALRHHDSFFFSAIEVGGILSAIKYSSFLKNCLLPHWWQPKDLPYIWIVSLCFSSSAGFIFESLPFLLAWRPFDNKLDGKAVWNDFRSMNKKTPKESIISGWDKHLNIRPFWIKWNNGFLPGSTKSSILFDRCKQAVVERRPKVPLTKKGWPLWIDKLPANLWTTFVSRQKESVTIPNLVVVKLVGCALDLSRSNQLVKFILRAATLSITNFIIWEKAIIVVNRRNRGSEVGNYPLEPTDNHKPVAYQGRIRWNLSWDGTIQSIPPKLSKTFKKRLGIKNFSIPDGNVLGANVIFDQVFIWSV